MTPKQACHYWVACDPSTYFLPRGVTIRFGSHIMATPGIENVPESEHWEQDELTEMMSLLQRAEQRMRMSNQFCKHAVRAQNLDK